MGVVLKKFKETREDMGLSVSDVTDTLRIGREYIEAIENSEFDKLPDRVYAIGFIRNYARFLGIDEVEAIAEYKDKTDIVESPRIVSKKPGKRKTPDFYTECVRLLNSFRVQDVSICNIAYVVLILAIIAVLIDVSHATTGGY